MAMALFVTFKNYSIVEDSFGVIQLTKRDRLTHRAQNGHSICVECLHGQLIDIDIKVFIEKFSFKI